MSWFLALVKSKRVWITLISIALFGAIFLYLIDILIMPSYTNYKEGLTVPDVTKTSLQDAGKRLENYGLRYEVVERRSHPAYPSDYIIDQNPSPSQVVKPNRKIYLTVNTAIQPKVNVPDVTNLSLRNAKIQLQNYGLEVGTISYVSSRFKNTVLRQSIPGGKRVDKGAVVDLTVSDGLGVKLVQIPEIQGLRLSEAQNQLSQVGLRVGEIRFKPSQDFTPNTVLNYSPSDKDSIVTGSVLNLVVSERFSTEEETESGAVIIDSTEATEPDTTQQDSL